MFSKKIIPDFSPRYNPKVEVEVVHPVKPLFTKQTRQAFTAQYVPSVITTETPELPPAPIPQVAQDSPLVTFEPVISGFAPESSWASSTASYFLLSNANVPGAGVTSVNGLSGAVEVTPGLYTTVTQFGQEIRVNAPTLGLPTDADPPSCFGTANRGLTIANSASVLAGTANATANLALSQSGVTSVNGGAGGITIAPGSNVTVGTLGSVITINASGAGAQGAQGATGAQGAQGS